MRTKIMILILSCVGSAHADKVNHNPNTGEVFTKKIRLIVGAMELADIKSEQDYYSKLQTACKNSGCNSVEKKSIKIIGRRLVHCQTQYLKSQGIVNDDATILCESKMAMIGCDSLRTPLQRKMCYTGNKYDVNSLAKKEKTFKNRMPASQ